MQCIRFVFILMSSLEFNIGMFKREFNSIKKPWSFIPLTSFRTKWDIPEAYTQNTPSASNYYCYYRSCCNCISITPSLINIVHLNAGHFLRTKTKSSFISLRFSYSFNIHFVNCVHVSRAERMTSVLLTRYFFLLKRSQPADCM